MLSNKTSLKINPKGVEWGYSQSFVKAGQVLQHQTQKKTYVLFHRGVMMKQNNMYLPQLTATNLDAHCCLKIFVWCRHISHNLNFRA